METVTFLDTHVAVWLYAGFMERFPGGILQRLESDPPAISPLVLLEMQYLYELGRLKEPPVLLMKELEMALGLRIINDPVENLVLASLSLNWTRDPFDRLIVAQAEMHQAPLITKDRTIRQNYRQAVW